MAKQLQLRRGTTAEISAFTGAAGEPTFDTSTSRVQIHDGVTPGGFNIDRIRVATSPPTPSTQLAGELVHFDSTNRALYVWDGTHWVTIIAPP